MSLLVLNAGSSSLKFALFAAQRESAALLTGQVDGLGSRPRLSLRGPAGGRLVDEALTSAGHPPMRDVHDALGLVLSRMASWAPGLRVRAVGHRVVHGGMNLDSPRLVDEHLLAELQDLSALAPLHQPYNLEGIRAAMSHFPGVPQVACFDTAFHRGHPFVHEAFALPREYFDAGVRRYGFHGLSYEYIAHRLGELDPAAATGRTIVAHLGSGASICALRAGRSVSSSMGFTALDGLPMGTRPGQLDPGVLLWLISERGMDAAALTELLYKRSGLKGLSGVSNDMRELRASGEPGAREAIDYLVARLREAIGAMAATLGGLDCLVFTAGIGENDAALRQQTVEGLGFLGLSIELQANAEHGARTGGLISPPASPVRVRVLPTNEEWMIARHLRALTGV